ncbi:hypothetical protein PSTT_04802, partial [Puccinia striiformis]
TSTLEVKGLYNSKKFTLESLSTLFPREEHLWSSPTRPEPIGRSTEDGLGQDELHYLLKTDGFMRVVSLIRRASHWRSRC